MVITDHINKLEATVTYNPPKADGGGVMKSLRKKLFKTSKSEIKEQLSDYFTIQICQKVSNTSKQVKDKVVVSEGSGSWLEKIEFDNKVYWTINDELPQWLKPNSESVRED